ncbi:hypothetical protein AB0E75_02210 [Streptomyces griseoviridis]|uniref:Secreted protein n=3 Tax=Streptomyces TaxID=1883 RepID=A0A918G3Q0_STRGD|nr:MULTISPECIES: hypothetical protein [Streptomyces]MDP9681857.1 hypothetical protein [Streptomyces griseoviridis]GGS17899.1 hypothetical protein GCM10010238_02490 [Streptomyces niveoruber]GGS71586.1 hypothetical protein GCM10010240_00280 [Streptomyces griseoviridis]GGU33173.1 hypothetical protein GCM10010259_24490 [Streptomyces daghestanicus]GHI34157.1 hypothetical protein Sdagh_58870 [Streptomyces daghestanicus]
MKSLKAAAVLAGTLVAASAAAPAFAYDPADTAALTPTSLNGAVNALTAGPALDPMPIKHQSRQSNLLDTENKDSVLHDVKGATSKLNSKGGLLGGLPLGR